MSSELRAGDHAWVCREAVRKYGGDVLLVSITAPGSDVLPLGSDGRCSYGALQSWSSDFMHRWNALRARARRRLGGHRSRTPIIITRYDVQRRGAPHIHLVVERSTVGLNFAHSVKLLAREHGFGFVDVSETRGAHPVAVAQYAAAYVSRNLDGRAYGSSLLPKRVLHVSREWSFRSGADMEVARAKRRLWVYANVTRDVGLTPRMEWDEVFSSKVSYHYRVALRGVDKVRDSVIDWDAEYVKLREDRKVRRDREVHCDRLAGEDGEEEGGGWDGEGVPQQESLFGPGEWRGDSDVARRRRRSSRVRNGD